MELGCLWTEILDSLFCVGVFFTAIGLAVVLFGSAELNDSPSVIFLHLKVLGCLTLLFSEYFGFSKSSRAAM